MGCEIWRAHLTAARPRLDTSPQAPARRPQEAEPAPAQTVPRLPTREAAHLRTGALTRALCSITRCGGDGISRRWAVGGASSRSWSCRECSGSGNRTRAGRGKATRRRPGRGPTGRLGGYWRAMRQQPRQLGGWQGKARHRRPAGHARPQLLRLQP